MRRRMSRCALLLAACGIPVTVLAQSGPPAATAERPRFYLWSQDGTPCGITPSASSMQVAIVKIYADDNTSGANAAGAWHQQSVDPCHRGT